MTHLTPVQASYLRRVWVRVRAYEPARLRAAWAALGGVALALGFTIPAGVDGKVQAAITVAAAVLPLLQGEWTRAAVWSPATVTAITTAPDVTTPLPTPVAPVADDGSVEGI